jgi:hypothetical protein
VRLYPGQNETSALVAAGDAVTLGQIMDAIEARATQLANEGSSLPAGLRRFTALADLVVGQRLVHPAVETVVTVDLTTLLGLNQHPGELSGYGPISADLARELSNDATLRRLVTDPVTGAMADLGRRSYAPSRHLRRVVNAQHRTCRFPGCARRDIDCDCDCDCDCDHETPWSRGGRTDRGNLHPLCRMHHNLKTRKLCHVDINADGTEIWTSALGFRYTKSAATYPLELLEPPEDEPIPEQRDTIPESAPDPPFPDEPLPTPPPLTDCEYDAVLDALDRNFGSYAERVCDTLRSVDLIA